MRLRADVVTVHQNGRRPSKVVAEGRPVRFEQRSTKGPVKGEARRVEYDVNSENLVLAGDDGVGLALEASARGGHVEGDGLTLGLAFGW